MTDENKTEQLLASFYNGETTQEEEKLLATFFDRKDISEKWLVDSELFHVLYDPTRIPLPEGLAERLEKKIDRHQQEQTVRKSGSKARKLYVSLLSAAAVVLLCIGIFVFIHKNSKSDFIADTFTNPQEAAIAAEQTLLYVSSKLNQGLAPLEKVKESIHKTNEIINENVRLN